MANNKSRGPLVSLASRIVGSVFPSSTVVCIVPFFFNWTVAISDASEIVEWAGYGHEVWMVSCDGAVMQAGLFHSIIIAFKCFPVRLSLVDVYKRCCCMHWGCPSFATLPCRSSLRVASCGCRACSLCRGLCRRVRRLRRPWLWCLGLVHG